MHCCPCGSKGTNRLRWAQAVALHAYATHRSIQTRLQARILMFRLNSVACIHHRQELVSQAAGLAFKVVNGIPNMIVADARKLSESE